MRKMIYLFTFFTYMLILGYKRQLFYIIFIHKVI